MTRDLIAIATLFVMSSGVLPALDLPRFGQTGTTCPQAGARKGKKLGPQDGTGPIHAPGTGGGTGAGRRAGRR
jgi:hypothetical protein